MGRAEKSEQSNVAVSLPTKNVAAESNATSFTAVIPQWWAVVKVWFIGEERWKARGYAAAVVAFALSTTLLSVRISYAQRRLNTALAEKDTAGFYKAVWEFIAIIVFATPFYALSAFVEERLILAWRAYMTRRVLGAYFSDKAYFNVQHQHAGAIDNPDQRICEDIRSFVRTSVLVCITILHKIFNCVAFAGVLWTISSNLVLFLLFYATTGTAISTFVFGKVLMTLCNRLLHREADMRFSLVRVRENAESIAFYGGERQERRGVASRLNVILDVTARKIQWQAYFDLWANAYSYATILIPSLLTAPRFFSGEVEFGVVTQTGFAFSRIESALSIIINKLDQLSGLAAQTERIQVLMDALDMHVGAHHANLDARLGRDRVMREVVPEGEGVALQKLTVHIPRSPSLICQDLSFSVLPGESLLVVGPSGCGKSSLLRVIAGLWVEGHGTISMPASHRLFFLPQKPFMPLGNLRRNLLFPSGMEPEGEDLADSSAAQHAAEVEMSPLLAPGGRSMGGGEDMGPQDVGADVSDAKLLSLLEDVSLGKLVEKVGSLDAEMEWSHVLSLGEQQRVALLRLLLHQPAAAFLDEATSAVDPATESRMYALLQKTCSCFVSVGHRQQLVRFHTHVLECLGDGVWQKVPAAVWAKRPDVQAGMQI